MPANPQKFSFLLSGGMDNRNMDDLISPTVQHGSTPHVALSRNTRFGVVPGRIVRAPAAAKFVDNLTVGTPVMGMVSESKSRRTAVMIAPSSVSASNGTAVSNNLDDSPFQTGFGRSFLTADQRQNHLGALGCSGFAATSRQPYGAVAVAKNLNTGIVWRVYREHASPSYQVRIEGFDGDALVMSTFAESEANVSSQWIGVTCHGSTHECVVWHANSAGVLRAIRVSRTGTGAGFSTTLYTIATPGAVTHGLDVVAISDTEAAVVYPASADPDDATLAIVDITTGSVSTSTTETGVLATGGSARLAFGTISGNERIVAAYVEPGSTQAFARIYSTALATVATTATETCNGRAEIALTRDDFSDGFVLALDVSTTLVRVVMQAYDASAAKILGALDIIYERALTGHSATMEIAADRKVPFFGLIKQWFRTSDDIGEANYVDDPALEVWWVPVVIGNNASLAARLGCVRGSQAPFDYFAGTGMIAPSPGFTADASSLHAAYLQYNGQSDLTALRQVSHAVLTLGGSHRPVAFDRDGGGLLASAVPAYWDGASLTPIGSPIDPPHVATTTASGTALLAAGTYGVLAIFEWVDACGLVHRSRPSRVVSATLNGTTDELSVAVSGAPPLCTRQARIKLYVTDTDGSSYHLHSVGGPDADGLTFSNLAPVDTAQEQIYTTQGAGEELAPQPPPPAADIAVIGDRCWILDAEIRSRYVYSKRRIAGTAFEFVPSFEVFLPSGAGEGVAVREYNGLVILIAERGVFQVSGFGPSNSLGGAGDFSAPVKVSEIGCSNTASVVEYPGGIMWQDRERFVRMTGAGVVYDRVFGCTHDVSAACVMSRYQEVLFFSASQAEIRVYNYELDRWSVWDSQVLGGAVTTAHAFAGDADKVVTWSQGASEGSYLDADTVSSAANMVVETGWIAPGGDLQDDCEVDHVVINGRHDGGSHTLNAKVYTDYDETNARPDRTFSNATLVAHGTGHGGRYSERIEPTVIGGLRVIKLRLTDALTSGGGMDPRHVTMVFRRENILREDAFEAGSDV